MEHSEHEPGTMQECPECRALAVEPGWYKVMRDERLLSRGGHRIVVPEADATDVDVVLPEVPARPDIEVLDLEVVERDE